MSENPSTGRRRATSAAIATGLVLTVLATIAPFVDHATTHRLAEHIRAGYPTYTDARVDSAVTAYLALLGAVGALGIAAWLGTAWAVRRGTRWARPAATVTFGLGTSVALTALLTEDTSGEVGLDPLLGWVWTMPSLAGLLTVALMWTSQRHR